MERPPAPRDEDGEAQQHCPRQELSEQDASHPQTDDHHKDDYDHAGQKEASDVEDRELRCLTRRPIEHRGYECEGCRERDQQCENAHGHEIDTQNRFAHERKAEASTHDNHESGNCQGR